MQFPNGTTGLKNHANLHKTKACSRTGLSFRTFSGKSGNLFFRKVEFSMISWVFKRNVLEFPIKNDKLL